MWSYGHGVEADVTAEAVWRAWADVESWGEWNADIERISIDGPFAVGATIEMTPRGADPVVLRVAEVRPGECFVDEAEVGRTVVATTHLVEPAGEGRVRIVYRTEITGPASEEVGPQLGPAITDDFPETIAALVAYAR
ncbi:MAG TPA: SRPBCC family protein [Solirubrobacterales bacterium]